MTSTLEIPTITPHDLSAFHEAHLAPNFHPYFIATFFPPPQPPASTSASSYTDPPLPELELPDEEDDDLGYYPDGVKRTLTPTQVSIFRFSETQALLRRKRREAAKKEDDKERSAMAGDEDYNPSDVPKPLPEVSPEEQRRGRLQAAMWASSLPWDEQVKEESRRATRVLETVDVGTGRNFLWPVIEKE